MFGRRELVTYVHWSPEFLTWMCVVRGVLLVQIAIVFWGPVRGAFQRLLGVWGLAVSCITGPSVSVRQAAAPCTKFQAGAASIDGGCVGCAIGRGVRALDLQGAQVLWGASLVLISHLRHHQRRTVHRGWKQAKSIIRMVSGLQLVITLITGWSSSFIVLSLSQKIIKTVYPIF